MQVLIVALLTEQLCRMWHQSVPLGLVSNSGVKVNVCAWLLSIAQH